MVEGMGRGLAGREMDCWERSTGAATCGDWTDACQLLCAEGMGPGELGYNSCCGVDLPSPEGEANVRAKRGGELWVEGLQIAGWMIPAWLESCWKMSSCIWL